MPRHPPKDDKDKKLTMHKRPKKRIKAAVETAGPNYRKLEERFKGFDPNIEPKVRKQIVQCHNDRGYDIETFKDTLPSKNYFHPDLFGAGYPPAKKIEAAAAWWATGSFQRAERMCGVPANTIRNWKTTEWWQLVTSEIKKEKNEEMDAKMTGLMMEALDQIGDRVSEGDYVYNARLDELRRKPMNGKELAVTHAFLFEKRALLRGDPTAKIEKITTDQRLTKLQEEFKKFSKAKTINGAVIQGSDEE